MPLPPRVASGISQLFGQSEACRRAAGYPSNGPKVVACPACVIGGLLEIGCNELGDAEEKTRFLF